MTEVDLQKEIRKIIVQELIPDMKIFEPNTFKGFLQDIPLDLGYGDEIEIVDKNVPCCIVKINAGEINGASKPETVTVEIIIVIKDESEDMSGYQTLMVIINRIRDYFTANVGIQNKYRMKYPIKWGINDNTIAPYFVGNLITQWDIERMPFHAIARFL